MITFSVFVLGVVLGSLVTRYLDTRSLTVDPRDVIGARIKLDTQ